MVQEDVVHNVIFAHAHKLGYRGDQSRAHGIIVGAVHVLARPVSTPTFTCVEMSTWCDVSDQWAYSVCRMLLVYLHSSLSGLLLLLLLLPRALVSGDLACQPVSGCKCQGSGFQLDISGLFSYPKMLVNSRMRTFARSSSYGRWVTFDHSTAGYPVEARAFPSVPAMEPNATVWQRLVS